ncbi:hypothetical protein HAX54_043653, partial [Datura stramonium]|nr:hypothetical protein [Datura stramonium]
MSADERDSTTLRAIKSGAAFFILKPICEDDIRDLWQYAIMRKNNYKTVVIDEIDKSFNGLIEKIHHHEVIVVESSPSVCEEFNEKMDKPGRKDEDNVFKPSNKSNIVWTPSLHSRFLDAIREIGLD